MRLALKSGEWDWEAFGQEMPEHILNGWLAFFAKEPFGDDQWFDFLSNAFVLLGKAFHSPELAFELDKENYCPWRKPRELTEAEEAELDLSDDELIAQLDRLQMATTKKPIARPQAGSA